MNSLYSALTKNVRNRTPNLEISFVLRLSAQIRCVPAQCAFLMSSRVHMLDTRATAQAVKNKLYGRSISWYGGWLQVVFAAGTMVCAGMFVDYLVRRSDGW